MGAPTAAPVVTIRETPEDFLVEEISLYPPSGEGNHTFLWVEKRDQGTEEVARALARFAGAAARDVGYAGRKDRRAIARQWFSVPALDPERALVFCAEGVRVLRAHRHPHKLRVGHLRGNRFTLRVRGVAAADVDPLRDRLAEIARRGFPNRFGRQRYGRDGDNPERARAIVASGRVPRNRRHFRFLLSALQSQVFDTALSERDEAIDRVERGDVAQVCESGGLFTVEDPDLDNERAARFEISCTGPIFGTRVMAPSGAPGARERELLARYEIPALLEQARGVRLRGGRRALRAALEAPALEIEPTALRLDFSLASGCYATVFLESLFEGPVNDAPRTDRYPMASTPNADSKARQVHPTTAKDHS